ncbi:NinI-like serine-threonine phosphatase [Vibrio phage pVp-1]|uniref:Serine/threonine specific protein phosphatases domain-containing protein n=1 Tax=Vibrio phage pVp-1 TaxID=1150989 RepID=H6WXJ1_9CAUD|nr:NinI-like serine-threonine phosphatase [Vibrio phage pVp-1]AFB83957.1 hypothetical protein pVp-1_0100 [Vibrio phage pVp-1]
MSVIDITDRRNIYFVGDLHGDWKALKFFLDQVEFNYRDIIVSVGDLFDRGEQNLEVVNFFLFTENALAVRGNHEDMAIQGLLHGENNQAASWIMNGGGWSLDFPQAMIEGILRKMEQEFPLVLTLRHENTKFGVTHAECPTEVWDDYVQRAGKYFPDDNRAVWGRDAIKGRRFSKIRGVDYTIHGHSVRDCVTSIGNQMWIDTGSVFDGGDRKYGLTVMEWDNGGWVNHRIIRNHFEPNGLEHLII